MIIGVPTDDGKLVSGHFGRARYFLIIDGKESRLVENPHLMDESDQSGHGKLLKMLVQNKVTKVFCSDLNPRMEKDLSSLKIQVARVPADAQISRIIS